MTRILYLHGFASSRSSRKALYFQDRFAAAGTSVEILDLAADDFEHLTLTRQLAVVDSAARGEAVALMGSSMGGYLAALYAARHPEVQRVVLLAPAFGFAERWREHLGHVQVEEWRRSGAIDVFHYGDKRNRRLAYDLLPDADRYETFPDFRQPALIFHGEHGDVVPAHYSREFAARQPNAILDVLDSGHDLLDQLDYMATRAVPFLMSAG